MLFAEIDWGQSATLITAFVVAGAGAWVALRKSKTENDLITRNGEIGEWRELLDKSKEENEELLKRSKEENGETIAQLKMELREQKEKCSDRSDGQVAEIKELRIENVKIHGEMSALRAQITARETERVEQRGEIKKLEKTIAEVAKPDTEALAQALAPELAKVMSPVDGAAPMPVKIVGQSEAPIRTKDQP